MGGNHRIVDIRQQPDGIVPADGGENSGDGVIPKGVHQVPGPQLRMRVDKGRTLQRVGHGTHAQAEVLFQPPLCNQIPVEQLRLPQAAPGQADHRHRIPGLQPHGPLHNSSSIRTSESWNHLSEYSTY